MKQIINNRRYDTETGELLGSDSYSNKRDFYHWTEELYRKRNGEFFLYGEGGPNTKYAHSVGLNEWTGGEKIIPLTADAARKWAEEHLEADEYEKIFEVIEDDENDEKISWTVRVSPATIERARRVAGEKNMKLSEVVESAVRAFMNEI